MKFGLRISNLKRGLAERPVPVCLVARELRDRTGVQLWQDDLLRSPCPYPLGRDCLLVVFFASAELGCHRVIRLARSGHILDLFVEFRNLRNGVGGGRSLLDAALAFQLPDAMSAAEKDSNRQRTSGWAVVVRGT